MEKGSTVCNLCTKKSLPCIFKNNSTIDTHSRSQSAPPTGLSHDIRSQPTVANHSRNPTSSQVLQSKPQATIAALTSQAGKWKAVPAAAESIHQPVLKHQCHSPSEEESWTHILALGALEAVPELDKPSDNISTAYWQLPNSSQFPDATEVLSIITSKQVDVMTSDKDEDVEMCRDEAVSIDEGEIFKTRMDQIKDEGLEGNDSDMEGLYVHSQSMKLLRSLPKAVGKNKASAQLISNPDDPATCSKLSHLVSTAMLLLTDSFVC